MVFKISEPAATPAFGRTTIQSWDFSSPLGLRRSISAPRAHVEQITDDLCSMQCSSVAYEEESKGSAHSLSLPTDAFFYQPCPKLLFLAKLSAWQKDNQKQGMSNNTYFLWPISCQTRKKSLPILLELPVRVSMLLHCPRTHCCVSLSFLLTSYLVLFLIVRN